MACIRSVKSERGSELEMPEIVAWLSCWCVFALVSWGLLKNGVNGGGLLKRWECLLKLVLADSMMEGRLQVGMHESTII